MFVRRIALIPLALLCMSTVAILQKRAASVEIVGHVVKPEQLSPTSIQLQPQAFKVAAGFSVSVFAEGLGKPRMLEVADDGTVYVSQREPGDGAAIPMPYSGYGERFSPPLRWSNAPASTKSFVLLMEDPDAKTPKPYLHWLLYNVPAETTRLPESVPAPPRLEEPKGALQGRNSRGHIGYVGPRPPEGDPPHHYHFQIFALDTLLNVPLGADREAVLTAMTGHVIARGELVGTFQRAK